jgi:iron(III) transport system ATP-binding protein
MATEFIQVRDVCLRLGQFQLGPLSLAVKRGDLLAVVGPSGSGKTTLLRCVAGFERPDGGTLIIDGRVIADETHWVEPEDRRMGMVFQDYALFPHLTVEQNVAFGLPGCSSRARARELLELVGLSGFWDRYPHELSGGEQQRVALARSLATDPKVLLLDEPFSNLDADLRPKMRAELKLLLQRLNCTTVFVTHDQEEAFELADQVAVLNAGRLEQMDTPERLYREPATRFVAEFIGHADFLTGRVRGSCIETVIGCFALPRSLPEGTVGDVMVRPEEVEVEVLTCRGKKSFAPTSWLSRAGPYRREEMGVRAVVTSEGLIVSRRYRGGVQLITVRLSSGEALRSLQPAGAHFPLAARVRVRAKTQTPTVFVGEARVL